MEGYKYYGIQFSDTYYYSSSVIVIKFYFNILKKSNDKNIDQILIIK